MSPSVSPLWKSTRVAGPLCISEGDRRLRSLLGSGRRCSNSEEGRKGSRGAKLVSKFFLRADPRVRLAASEKGSAPS